ncbi:MAG: hypothetical protein AAGJ83_10395, partial [Planctomycetota bacterium]
TSVMDSPTVGTSTSTISLTAEVVLLVDESRLQIACGFATTGPEKDSETLGGCHDCAQESAYKSAIAVLMTGPAPRHKPVLRAGDPSGVE